jgi:hypothetical protein
MVCQRAVYQEFNAIVHEEKQKVERVFFTAGDILTPQRASLKERLPTLAHDLHTFSRNVIKMFIIV